MCCVLFQLIGDCRSTWLSSLPLTMNNTTMASSWNVAMLLSANPGSELLRVSPLITCCDAVRLWVTMGIISQLTVHHKFEMKVICMCMHVYNSGQSGYEDIILNWMLSRQKSLWGTECRTYLGTWSDIPSVQLWSTMFSLIKLHQ